MFDVSGHAYDRDPLHPRVPRPTNAFPQRVFIWKVTADHRFVCDSHERRVLRKITRIKIATRPQRDLHGPKVVTLYAARFQTWFGARLDGLSTLDEKIMIQIVATEWQFTYDRRLHTR
jgi:hypothetical protein